MPLRNFMTAPSLTPTKSLKYDVDKCSRGSTELVKPLTIIINTVTTIFRMKRLGIQLALVVIVTPKCIIQLALLVVIVTP